MEIKELIQLNKAFNKANAGAIIQLSNNEIIYIKNNCLIKAHGISTTATNSPTFADFLRYVANNKIIAVFKDFEHYAREQLKNNNKYLTLSY